MLLLERTYGNASYDASIRDIATLKARQMGVSLLHNEHGDPNDLVDAKSVGGIAPYEYSDTHTGEFRDGILQIRQARRLYRPDVAPRAEPPPRKARKTLGRLWG